MKLNKLSALVASSVLLATASTTTMADESAWETSANVALSSEYVWRGVGQTQSDPAISGGFDIGHESGFYAGTWASNVDFDDDSDANIEIDYYAGFGGDFGDSGFSYDVGFIYYDYPGTENEDLDFTEVYAFVGYDFLSAGVSYTIDADDADWEDGVYYQLDAGYDVGSISLAAGVGYYDFDADDVYEDYTNWYLGASTEFAGLGLDVTYHDNDVDGGEDTVVLTISKSM
jgi:uncharacterized protein (TIGR02001 family)